VTPRLILFISVLAGCGAPAPVASPLPSPPVARAEAAGPRRPPFEVEPLSASVAPVDAERWVLPTSSAALLEGRLVAVGEELGLIETAGMNYLVSSSVGMLGRLRAPAVATWLGVSATDVVYAASPGGHLYRAAGLKERPTGHFERVATLHAAVSWDVAGDWVVAGGREQVWRSRDGGQSFESLVVSPRFDVRRVLVRPDGLLLVSGYNQQGGRALRLLKDGVWRRSTHSVTGLDRRGTHITARSVGGCAVTLADDGQSWVGVPEGTRRRLHLGLTEEGNPTPARPWVDLTGGSSVTEYNQPPGWNGVDPPPPPASGRLGPNDCEADGDVLMGGLFGMVNLANRACTGVACMRELPPQRRTDVAFEIYRRPCASADGCAEKPFSIAVEHRRSRMLLRVPAPEGCVPEMIRDLAGAGWLVCEDGRTHSVAGDGRVYAEDRLPWRPTDVGSVTTSDDGTVVVTCGVDACSDRFLVRRPAALGHAGAWREVEAEGVKALIPSRDGRVVALTSSGDPSALQRKGGFGLGSGIGFGGIGTLGKGRRASSSTERMKAAEAARKKEAAAFEARKAAETPKLQRASLTLHHADGRREVLAEDVTVAFDARYLELDPEGRPIVLSREGDGRASYLLAGGKLVPTKPQPDPPSSNASRPFWGRLDGQRVSLDAHHFYWVQEGRVMRMPRKGATPEVFVDDVPRAAALAGDASHLFVAVRGDDRRDGEVLRITKKDGERERIFTGLVRPVALRAVGGVLVVADDGDERVDDGAIHLRTSTGHVRVLIQSLGAIRGLAVDDERVLVTSGRRVLSIPRRGDGAAEVVAVGRRPQAVALVEGEVWWVDDEADAVWGRGRREAGAFIRPRTVVGHGTTIMVANGRRVWLKRSGRWRSVAGEDVGALLLERDVSFLVGAPSAALTRLERFELATATRSLVYEAPAD